MPDISSMISEIVAAVATVLSIVLGYLATRQKSRDEALVAYQENVGNEVARLDQRTEKYWKRIQELEVDVCEWREKYLNLQAESQEIRSQLKVISVQIEQQKNLIQMMQDREEDYRIQIQDLKEHLRSLGFGSEAYLDKPDS